MHDAYPYGKLKGYPCFLRKQLGGLSIIPCYLLSRGLWPIIAMCPATLDVNSTVPPPSFIHPHRKSSLRDRHVERTRSPQRTSRRDPHSESYRASRAWKPPMKGRNDVRMVSSPRGLHQHEYHHPTHKAPDLTFPRASRSGQWVEKVLICLGNFMDLECFPLQTHVPPKRRRAPPPNASRPLLWELALLEHKCSL